MPFMHSALLGAHHNVLSGTAIGTNLTCNSMRIVNDAGAEPATYAEATGARSLIAVAMIAGDFTVSDGDVSGRKVVVTAKTGVSVTTTGVATYVALVNTTGSNLLATNPLEAQVNVTAATTITINSWRMENLAPVAV